MWERLKSDEQYAEFYYLGKTKYSSFLLVMPSKGNLFFLFFRPKYSILRNCDLDLGIIYEAQLGAKSSFFLEAVTLVRESLLKYD